MKKISILSLHLGYGGIEKSIVSLANILCTRYEVEIATCYKLYEKCVFDLDDRVRVIYLNSDDIVPNHDSLKEAFRSRNFIKMFKEGTFAAKVLHSRKKSMVRYLRKCNSDVIISTRSIFNEWSGIYAREEALKIGWEHNRSYDDLKYVTKVIDSSKNLDYLVLISSGSQKFYHNHMEGKKCMCIYIPNGIEKMPPKQSPLSGKRLISVGRLSPEKGYIDLLRIYHILYKKYPNWKLDIVGDGKEKALLEEYIRVHNMEKYVTLHGFQDGDSIDQLMQKSSIYLMTSHEDSYGVVLMEAMSHGIPCIAMDSAEVAREIINSGENGYLIKHRNYDMMVKKISDLIEDKKERIKLGDNARRSVEKYTGDMVGENWFTLIEESDVYE